MAIITLFQNEPTLFYSFIFILGLLIGSFINVVIYRLPKILKKTWQSDCEEFLNEINNKPQLDSKEGDTPVTKYNLSTPRSTCPECGHLISAIENIPVISYVFLKGKCRECNTKISVRYPLIELFCATIALIVAMKFGVTMTAIAMIVLSWALIALSMIDYDHQFLPDEITLPLLWAGLLFNAYFKTIPLFDAVLGASLGYLAFWSLYKIFKLVTGKEGMGYGDFKLLALLGAWFGWQSLLMIILISSLTGAIVGITLIILKIQERSKPIPFGPYLAFAGWVVMMWGETIKLYYYQ
ncbi:Leader peptidase (Prepilin peptidase) / N-methyltransferase [hydrothermal vent metagenome]|uniref:Leader peptidase (Prepilin peptidase) / N-methyltransferase n=1 Tax=hydrothermal vent metagenome TaxID=652676 RepID=A0A3B1AI26_9ZZZZ